MQQRLNTRRSIILSYNMDTIVVSINKDGFEYDINALVKAFYPNTEVKVGSPDLTLSSSEGLPDIQIAFEDGAILFSVLDGKSDTIKADISEVSDKGVIKNILKQLIYYGLNHLTGKRLPWGILTGIRPVKLVSGLLSDGATPDELNEYMKDVYLISDEKLLLSIEIAKNEKKITDILSKDGFSLYVGIPFCPSRCLYCSFASYPADKEKDRINAYLEALYKEISESSKLFKGKSPDSLYIGGGTPTTLTPGQLLELFFHINESFDLSNTKEITVEAGRPDSIDKERLLALKEAGITRISINPQTMNEDTLLKIGRKHTTEDIKKAFELARELGFDNINTDIILGLPDEGKNEVRHTIDEIKKLSPESLTIHSLAVKRASALSLKLKENNKFNMENTDDIMNIATEGARSMGMEPYYLYRQKNIAGNFENTGYALPGKYGIYNVAIMEEVQSILALGLGTVTKRVYADGRIERCDTAKDLDLYINDINGMIRRKINLFDGDNNG